MRTQPHGVQRLQVRLVGVGGHGQRQALPVGAMQGFEIGFERRAPGQPGIADRLRQGRFRQARFQRRVVGCRLRSSLQ